MQVSSRVRRGAIVALGLTVFAGVLAISSFGAGPLPPAVLAATATAQHGGGAFGGLGDVGPEPAPKVHIQAPVSAAAARIWAALDNPIDVPFPHETPLEDVLRYLKEATASDSHKAGIPIYVDPIGLTESDQTLTSPVVLDLEGIPLRTALGLMLRQLDLTYEVHPEGILIITSALSADNPITDPSLRILDELRQLRQEVSELRAKLEPPQPVRGGGFQ